MPAPRPDRATGVPMAGPWAWSSRGSLPAIAQPIEQQMSSVPGCQPGLSRRPAECSDRHRPPPCWHARPACASPARAGRRAPVQGRAGTACVPGASGLRNQALSVRGLPEPTCSTPAGSAGCRQWAGVRGSGDSATSHPPWPSRVLEGLRRASLAGSEMRRAVGVAIVTGTWKFWDWKEKVVTEAGKGQNADLFLKTTQYVLKNYRLQSGADSG